MRALALLTALMLGVSNLGGGSYAQEAPAAEDAATEEAGDAAAEATEAADAAGEAAEAAGEAAETAEEAATAAQEAAEVTQAEGATDAPVEAPSTEETQGILTDPELTPEELQLRVLPLTAAELTELADAWMAIVQGMTEAVIAETIAIREAEADGGEAVSRERLNALTDERRRGFQNFMSVVDSLELKGGDEAAIAGYRAYRNAIIVEETQAADWRTLLSQAVDWAQSEEGGLAVARNVAIVVGAFLGLLIVARFVRRIAARAFGRVPNLSQLLKAFLVMVVYWLTIAVGLMIVLGALGVNITPLFALVGGASFILAFAMQDTLGNLAAGLMIMINHPFDEGDYVTVAGVGGTVKAVSIVSTTVLTPDNQVIVIPNSKVWGDIITNVTASDTRRVDLTFGVSYDDDIDKAQEVLEGLVASHPLILADPEPVIRVNELADSSVNFVVRPWTRTADYWTVYWDLIRQVKAAFDREGISIPYPQTDLHLRLPEGVGAQAGGLSGERQRPEPIPPSTPAAAHPTDRTEAYAQGDDGFDEAPAAERADG